MHDVEIEKFFSLCLVQNWKGDPTSWNLTHHHVVRLGVPLLIFVWIQINNKSLLIYILTTQTILYIFSFVVHLLSQAIIELEKRESTVSEVVVRWFEGFMVCRK